MMRLSKVLMVTVALVAVAAIVAASAGASLPRPDRAKASAHVIQIRHGNIGPHNRRTHIVGAGPQLISHPSMVDCVASLPHLGQAMMRGPCQADG